ncbi:MAG: hypothetical protein ACOC10_08910 [Bacteroidota bacterium]
MMNKTKVVRIIIVLFMASLPFFACESLYVDCNECYFYEPDSADLFVQVTINDENPFVPLIFYKGNVRDSVVEWIDTATAENFFLFSPVHQFFSVVAKYRVGDKVIFAIDGDELKTNYQADVCTETCYTITGGEMDVRLKFE